MIAYSEHDWKDISMDARRLIIALLDRNIDRRLSAKEALAHPWFKKLPVSSDAATFSTCNLLLL